MSKKNLKIAIIGDYNFTYNTHHATNLAIDHASRFLEIEINYYWIKLAEACQYKNHQFQEFDGIWFSPGPYKNQFLLTGTIDLIQKQNLPTFITGEGFKGLIELIILRNNLNPQNEKLISENLVEGEIFEKIQIIPHSKAVIQLYTNHNQIELTSSRYSLYPQLTSFLIENQIDIEAYNQFEEPEIISLNSHAFFLACGFVPQISSTREIPHPLVYTFIKACLVL
jgi:CTP synthase (UTP-ammonia lyase)